MARRTAETKPAHLMVGKADVILAYKSVAATDEGRIVIADLVRKFGFSRTSTFVPGDPHRTSLNEGQRSVMVHFGVMIDADPAAVEEVYSNRGERE